jgi:hypothetical protein
MSTSNRWATAATIAAVGLGLWLRWGGLGEKSLWFDEGYTAWVVSLPPGQLVGAIRFDTAPPLYYLLLHNWARLAGTGEAALRMPSAACATLALGVMVAVVRRLFHDPWARAAAVSLLAVSFMQVAYAHEARFYALVGLLGAVDLYLASRACEGGGASLGWLAASAAAWAVSLWVNNIMVVDLACLAVAWLALPGRRPVAGRARDVAVVAVVAGLAFAPWVPALLAQRRAVGANFWSHTPGWVELPRMLALLGGISAEASVRGGGAALLALGGLAAIAARLRWRLVASLAAFGLLPVLVTFAYSRCATSIFMDRALIVSSLVLPLVMVVPLEAAREGRARAVAGGLVALLLAGSASSAWADRYRTPDHMEDWRAACRYAAGLPGPSRLTVFNANEGEMLYDYYARGGDYAPRPDLTGTPRGYFDLHPARTLQRVRDPADVELLRRAIAGGRFDAVVLVSAHAPFADPGGLTLALLQRTMRETDERSFDNVTVYRFAR